MTSESAGTSDDGPNIEASRSGGDGLRLPVGDRRVRGSRADEGGGRSSGPWRAQAAPIVMSPRLGAPQRICRLARRWFTRLPSGLPRAIHLSRTSSRNVHRSGLRQEYGEWESGLLVAASGPALEDDFALHHHVPDQPAPRFGEDLLPVAEPVVRHDRRVELAREGEDEVVGIGARRRL